MPPDTDAAQTRKAREICRVLKPGGKMLIDYPFLQGVHGYPHHYFNATPLGAVSLFQDACDNIASTIEPNNHPIHAIWWVLNSWVNGLASPDRLTFEALTIRDILSMPPDRHAQEPYCSALNEETRRTIPAGSTLIARKRAAPMPDASPAAREAALNAQIAAMRASHSWRLTAPLRAVSGALSRASRRRPKPR